MSKQLTLEFDTLDAQLRSKDVARIQRAVICMVAYHPDRVIQEDGIRCLRISFSQAANWCRANLASVRGLRLDSSAFRKALNVLIAKGIMARTAGILWLNTTNLSEWFELLSEPVKTPGFSAVSNCVQGVSKVCPTVSGCVQGVSAVSTGESLNERMNETSSFTQEGKPEPQLGCLPALPGELWELRKAEEREEFIYHWWIGHGLGAVLGIHAEVTRDALLGLVEIALTKRKPAAYFATARRNPADYLPAEGKSWLNKVRISAARRELETIG
jgi:hypothetical protein